MKKITLVLVMTAIFGAQTASAALVDANGNPIGTSGNATVGIGPAPVASAVVPPDPAVAPLREPVPAAVVKKKPVKKHTAKVKTSTSAKTSGASTTAQ